MSWFKVLKIQSIDEFYDDQRQREDEQRRIDESFTYHSMRTDFGDTIKAIEMNAIPMHQKYRRKDKKNHMKHLKWEHTLKNYLMEFKEFIKEQEN